MMGYRKVLLHWMGDYPDLEADSFEQELTEAGYCIVPLEPTEEMAWAALGARSLDRRGHVKSPPTRCLYRAMLAARPKE